MHIVKALLLCALIALSGCNQQKGEEIVPVPFEVTLSLMACLKTRECDQPVTEQVVKGETVHQVSLVDGNTTVVYFYTDRTRLGVTSKLGSGVQILMEDLDFDGKVDKITYVSSNRSEAQIYGPESPLYHDAQMMYQDAMKIAKQLIIPPDLLEILRNEEKRQKKEEEKKRRLFST